ncbi:MAG: hypothetical protein HOY75_13335 [Streptomyces sp.]|nr:hypothetical protein [Streptomyces sp.]
MTDTDQANRYDQLGPEARALVDDYDTIAIAEMLVAAKDELAALRQVARGYCPECGRGDAAPTVEDWQQQKQHADQLAAALTEALDRYKPHPLCGTGLGYISHPIDQAEYDRWRAALDAGPALTDPAGRLAIIRNAAARLLGYGASMSARWVLDTIDKGADELARTTPNNPTTSSNAKEN